MDRYTAQLSWVRRLKPWTLESPAQKGKSPATKKDKEPYNVAPGEVMCRILNLLHVEDVRDPRTLPVARIAKAVLKADMPLSQTAFMRSIRKKCNKIIDQRDLGHKPVEENLPAHHAVLAARILSEKLTHPDFVLYALLDTLYAHLLSWPGPDGNPMPAESIAMEKSAKEAAVAAKNAATATIDTLDHIRQLPDRIATTVASTIATSIASAEVDARDVAYEVNDGLAAKIDEVIQHKTQARGHQQPLAKTGGGQDSQVSMADVRVPPAGVRAEDPYQTPTSFCSVSRQTVGLRQVEAGRLTFRSTHASMAKCPDKVV